MTNNQNENLHKGLAYVNSLLLGIILFFTTRMVNNIDRVADNVVDLRVEVATIKTTVNQNTKRIDDIEVETVNPKSK